MRYIILILLASILSQLSVAGQKFTIAGKNACSSNVVEELLYNYENNNFVVISAGRNVEIETFDRFTANVPMRLIVDGDDKCRIKVESALSMVTNLISSNIYKFLCKRKMIAPFMQWCVHKSLKSVKTEGDFISGKGYPTIVQCTDINYSSLSNLASTLTMENLPLPVKLNQIYGEYIYDSLKPTVPCVDYPDPHPEVTFSTPYAIGIVLRAPEKIRIFRFRAIPIVYHPNMEYEIKWVQLNGCKNATTFHRYRRNVCPGSKWKSMTPARGYVDIVVDWEKVGHRVDVGVFCRMKGCNLFGPASIISFHTLPEERRRYYSDGNIDSIDYSDSINYNKMASFNSSLSCIKNWKDEYMLTGDGIILGFKRYVDNVEVARFSQSGNLMLEEYPSGMPRLIQSVRYVVEKNKDQMKVLKWQCSGNQQKISNAVPSHPKRNDFRILYAK